MDYERDTRLAYKSLTKAQSYKKLQTSGFNWARLATWRSNLCVEKALRKCHLTGSDRILDIPCGTGILANVLQKFPSTTIASDISKDMMNLALEDYRKTRLAGFVQSDITKTPFKNNSFQCIITLGLMHRLPEDIRNLVLEEISSLSNNYVIVSYSIDSPYQRIKKSLLKRLRSAYDPAPVAITLENILAELDLGGLMIREKYSIMPFFSAVVIFLLEKQ